MRRAGEAHCRVPPAPCSLLDRKRDRFFHLSEISSRKLAERLLDVDSSRTGVDGLRAELAKLRRTRSADNAFNPSRLESLNEVFNQTTEHFTTVRPLLAEIQREYFSVVTGILNVQKEKDYLRSKIQRLICEIGTTEMLQAEMGKVAKLSYRLLGVEERTQSGLKGMITNQEKKFLMYLVDLFVKELAKTYDEKTKMNLKFRGRKGFVKDWLLNESKKDPIFGELYKRMEVDEELQQYLEKIGTDDLSGDTSSLNDNVERKKDVEQLQKSIKIGKRELKSIEEKIEAYNAELLSWNQKIEEIKHFLPAGTRYSRSQYDLS